MKFGLRGIRKLLRSLGNPGREFVCIHIAGTNGKGSVAAMLAAILSAAGYRAGLYTSPHLIEFTERIRVNGTPISRKRVTELTRRLRPIINRNKNTFFEAATAMAFKHFALKQVDVAVIETGLGGRLDATNVVKPLLSAITTIGIEHAELLGNTIRSIAFEKAGIIKRNVPCVTGVESGAALAVIHQACNDRRSLLRTTREVEVSAQKMTFSGSSVSVRCGGIALDNVRLSLPGKFQLKNLSVAILAVDQLNRDGKLKVSERAIRYGLENVQKLTGLQARLSLVRSSPQVICDVAHNPDAARSLVKTLQSLGVKKIDLVFGAMRDKDYRSMLRALRPIARRLVLVKAQTDRSTSLDELQRAATRIGLRAESFERVSDGVMSALKNSKRKKRVLITGSNFVVGEALAFLQGKKYLTINQ